MEMEMEMEMERRLKQWHKRWLSPPLQGGFKAIQLKPSALQYHTKAKRERARERERQTDRKREVFASESD